MAKIVVILTFLLIAAGCRHESPSEQLSRLSEEFVYTVLSFSPSFATSVGLHEYRKESLDQTLDDFSSKAIDDQRRFYTGFQQRLRTLRFDQLSPEEQADLTILQDQTALALLDLNEVHTSSAQSDSVRRDARQCAVQPFVLEYAPKPKRFQDIIARLQKVPLYLDQAGSQPGLRAGHLDPGGHRGK